MAESSVTDTIPASTPAPVESAAPVTAHSALVSAEARLSEPAPSAGTPPVVTPPAGAKPATPGVPPTGAPAAPNAAITQLRDAYNRAKERLQAYGDMDAEEAKVALAQWRRFSADPLSYYRQLGTELAGHEEFGPKLKGDAEQPEPQPDMYTMVDGERHLVYSAAQLAKWRDWNNTNLMKQVDARVNPLQQWADQARETTEHNQIVEGARSQSASVMAEMRKYPHFTSENEPKIAAKLAVIPAATKKSIGAVASLYLAYQQFLKDDVFPGIDSAAEARIRGENAKKAASSGTVKPGSGPVGATPARPTNVKSLAEKMASGVYGT